MESMQGLCAIRGNLVYAPALGQLTTLSPGYIITRDGPGGRRAGPTSTPLGRRGGKLWGRGHYPWLL